MSCKFLEDKNSEESLKNIEKILSLNYKNAKVLWKKG